MSNAKKNSQFYKITTHTTVPLPVTKTGTITTKGINVVGVGTLMLTEVKNEDWVVNIATDEVRKVVAVRDNLYLSIDFPFTSELTTATFLVVRSRARSIKLNNIGAAGTIDGVVFAQNELVEFTKSSKTPHDVNDFVDPVIVNGANISVTELR